MLFSQLKIPSTWRPLFREMSRKGWDLESEHPEVPDWASRAPLVFSNQMGAQCYLCFFDLPVWCGNNRQRNGITIVGISHQFPKSQAEAETYSLALEANWEAGIDEFLSQSLS